MIEVNITLFIQMANFFVFLILMNFILYRPIRRIVAERRKVVADKQLVIEGFESQARAAVQDYDLRLQESRKAGFQRIQELKAAGYEEEKELLKKITDEAAAMLQQMRSQIQKDIGAARKELKNQVKSFSSELAQKILGRKI